MSPNTTNPAINIFTSAGASGRGTRTSGGGPGTRLEDSALFGVSDKLEWPDEASKAWLEGSPFALFRAANMSGAVTSPPQEGQGPVVPANESSTVSKTRQ